MQHYSEISTHPFYEYAAFARRVIRERFPEGAGDKVNIEAHTTDHQKIYRTLRHFNHFSSSSAPMRHTYINILSQLQSGSADIFCCYALGCLRRRYPTQKACFNIIYIHQPPPNLGLAHTHALLLIGPPATDCETAFTTHSNQLICDLWLNDIYLAKDFYTRQAESPSVYTWFLSPHVPTQVNTDIYFAPLKPLQGSLSIHTVQEFEIFYNVLEETVGIEEEQKAETKLGLSESTDEAKHLPNQGIFSVKGRERIIWEHDNPFIVGYVTDSHGICHTIRKFKAVNAFAFWDENSQAPATITFHKIGEDYVCEMGQLSKTPSLNTEQNIL